MAKTEAETTIYQAFVRAQAEFETPKKTATLVVGGGQKRTYADLGAYLDAVRPALHKHGLGLLQPVGFADDAISIQTVLVDGKGDKVESPVLNIPIDRTGNRNAVQALGSTITYARRYSLMSFLGLVGEDDDGEGANMSKAKQPAQQAKPVQQQNYRDKALAWLMNTTKTSDYWTSSTMSDLLGKTSQQASDVELGALVATISALPHGGGIIEEYNKHLKGAVE